LSNTIVKIVDFIYYFYHRCDDLHKGQAMMIDNLRALVGDCLM